MMPIECPREQDVLDAIASRRWPARCDDEFRTHVAGCEVCSDLMEVAAAFLEARDVDDEAPAVPSASLVWWRAQLRAREEAARLARRPLRAARVAALACATLVAVVAIQAVLPSAWRSIAAALAWRPALDPDAAAAVVIAIVTNRAVQFAAIAWAVIGPVAVYLAFARD